MLNGSLRLYDWFLRFTPEIERCSVTPKIISGDLEENLKKTASPVKVSDSCGFTRSHGDSADRVKEALDASGNWVE